MNSLDGLGASLISTVLICTASAGINGSEHSASVVTRSTAWQINRDIGVYGSFVIGLISFSRVIILLYSDSHPQ
jgi:hypothetical protein